MGGFFWLNVMCLDISDNFKSKKSMARSLNANYSSELRKFQRYCIYAFGVPFILMLVTIGVDHSGLDHSNPFKPNIGITRCWFEKDSSAILLYFYGPLGLLLLMNIFLFIFVGYKLASAGFLSKTMPSDNEQRYRKRVILFVKMSALMGIPWVMEIVSWAVGGEDHYWYFTDIINILRSVFVFFMFCCKPKVWEMLKNQSILAPLFQRFSCCRKIDHQDIYDPMSCGPFPSVL
ncbi:hypothetical protein B566_EDAN017471 [Ephemera danica]|nr:hypothetical protein B566_EDAN017471 [Ephemera danica]